MQSCGTSSGGTGRKHSLSLVTTFQTSRPSFAENDPNLYMGWYHCMRQTRQTMTTYEKTREPWQKVSVEPGPVKDWISVTDDETDPLYDQSTYDTSSDVRQFSWRAKEDARRSDTDPECRGELLVELDPDADDQTVGNTYRYGTGPDPVPLRIYMALKFAAKTGDAVPIESPVRGDDANGGRVKSSVGQFFTHELGYKVMHTQGAFGHKSNYEQLDMDDL